MPSHHLSDTRPDAAVLEAQRPAQDEEAPAAGAELASAPCELSATGVSAREEGAAADADRKIEHTPYGHRWYYEAISKCFLLLLLVVLCIGALNGYVNGILQVLGVFTALMIGSTISINWELKSLDPPRPPGGNHIVLMSHYQEERHVFDRLLRSVLQAQASAKWPVKVVVAAEERSLMMTEAWDMASLSPDPDRLQVFVAVHPKGLEGERPGLGSNLRNAVQYTVNETSLPLDGTMVTKVDGNCWMSPHFFAQLEHAWATMDDTVCFQVFISELDAHMEEYKHLSWLMRGMARVAGILHTMPTHVFYLCGFHSTFCMPLRMICRAGNWDPWMIQEDNLMLQRAVLASNGRISCRLLRASIYNAPALDVCDLVQQRFRCLVHGWLALGFSFGNLCRLRRAPFTMMIFAYSVFMQMALSVGLAGIPIICALNAPDGLWSREVNAIIGFSMQGLFVLFIASRAETTCRVPEALLTGPICLVLTALLYLFISVRFLLVSDTSLSYKTSRTLSSAKGGQVAVVV